MSEQDPRGCSLNPAAPVSSPDEHADSSRETKSARKQAPELVAFFCGPVHLRGIHVVSSTNPSDSLICDQAHE